MFNHSLIPLQSIMKTFIFGHFGQPKIALLGTNLQEHNFFAKTVNPSIQLLFAEYMLGIVYRAIYIL